AGGWKATLNRELTVLSQVFDAAIRDGTIKPAQKPVMPDRFRENPPRQGHIDPEAGATLMRHMPRGYALAFDFARWTGWRKSAVSRLAKTALNPHTGTIDLPPELAKNRDIATVPLHDGTQRILAEARKLPGNAASPTWSRTTGGRFGTGARSGLAAR